MTTVRRPGRRTILAAAAIAVCGIPLAGCPGPAAAPTGGAASTGSPAPAGAAATLTVATADTIESLDPALAYDTWSTAVVHAITRRLVDYDDQGKIVPDLAEKWDVTDGGRTYQFTLVKGATFSDGSAITAAHFKAALDRVRDPKTASKGAGFYTSIASVEAPEAQTLIVKQLTSDPTLLNILGMTFAAPYSPGKGASPALESGAYAVERYDPRAEVVLKRAKDAEDGEVGRIVLQLGVAETLQLTRFETGEVDLLPAIPAAEYDRVMNDPGEQKHVVQGEVNQTWYFGVNTEKAPWSNLKVRRAALLAIDRQQQVTLAGPGKVANGILPPHVPGYRTDRTLPGPDQDGARKLLVEAGFPNGIPESQKTTLWLAATDQNQRHAEAIQADLKAVGIPVELRPVTLSQFLSGYRKDADCWYNGWYPDFPDAGNFMEPVFHSRNIGPGKNNAARYRSKAFDTLLAEDQLLIDLPWIPLYYEVETRWFREGVSGVRVHPVWRQILTGIRKG